jgi:twitching motility protein PilU
LLLRLQNDQAPVSLIAQKKEEGEAATFTELSIDVRPDDGHRLSDAPPPWAIKQ